MSKSRVIAGLGLGLAAGTALGFYALAPNVPGGPSSSGSATHRELEEQKSAREVAEGKNKASDSVLEGVADTAVRDKLANKSVVLIFTEDASRSDVEATRGLLKKAGAKVTGGLTLTGKALQSSSGDDLKSIAANSLPAGAKLSEKNLAPGMHTGQLLGSALKSGDKAASETDRGVVFGSLKKADYIKYDGEAPKAADAAVIITGGQENDEANGNYATNFVADFSAGVNAAMKNVVLAGSPGSAEKEGALGIVRGKPEYAEGLTTVDDIDSVAGRITAVDALAREIKGRSGHFGAAENAASASVNAE